MKLPKTAPVPPVGETEARRFERRESTKSGAKSGSRLKRDTLGERVTVYLPPRLAATLRRRCVNERRSLSDAMTEAVEAWMATRSHVDE
jgi:hypothetical protein